MGIDMKNSEGYMDLVPYQALTNIEREDKAASKPAFRPLVYICAPFNGSVKENVLKATRFAEFAFNRGCIPLTPHLLFPFMDDSNEKERDLAIFMDIILMGKCQEVWVLGDVTSKGMSIEIEKAKKRRQPVRYFNKDFKEVDAL
nr:MAG TPA: deoxyribosyltransferase [Caudoviricetes sp.]